MTPSPHPPSMPSNIKDDLQICQPIPYTINVKDQHTSHIEQKEIQNNNTRRNCCLRMLSKPIITLIIFVGLILLFCFAPSESISQILSINQQLHQFQPQQPQCHHFTLYSIQKSGTHFLMEVIHHSEHYSNKTLHEFFHNNIHAFGLRDQPLKILDLLDSNLQKSKSFILQYNQAHLYCAVWKYIKVNDYRLVVLVRDPFDGTLSRILHEFEESAHCLKGQDCKAVHSTIVDPNKFIQYYLIRIRMLTRQLKIIYDMFPNDHILMKYEDIVENPQKNFDRLFAYLNCPSLSKESLESKYVPVHSNKQSISDTIQNIEELKAMVDSQESLFTQDPRYYEHLKARLRDVGTPGVYPLVPSKSFGPESCF